MTESPRPNHGAPIGEGMTGIGDTRTAPSGDTGAQAGATGLLTAWERRTRLWALVLAALALAVSALVGLVMIRTGWPPALTLVLALVPAFGVYTWQTRKIRRRHALLRAPFPSDWEAVLQRDVVFFRVLDPTAQRRFRRQLQVFLGEKRITGIRVQVDTTTRVLAAASAIIPIFGFPDWEWDQIDEVLVYPTRFDGEFEFGDGQGHDILGMVGTGSLNRLMILSKPDLIDGFRNPTDKRNVGVHEFAHLIDKTDGVIDGVPGVGLDRQAIGPVDRPGAAQDGRNRGWKVRHQPVRVDQRGGVLCRDVGVLLRAARHDATQAPSALRGARACVQAGPPHACGRAQARAGAGSADVRSKLAVPVREWPQVQEVLSTVTCPGLVKAARDGFPGLTDPRCCPSGSGGSSGPASCSCRRYTACPLTGTRCRGPS